MFPSTNFNLRTLLAASVPAYVFPAAMSFTSGFFRHDTALMQASYSSIATPSLISALLTFALLWQLEVHQVLVPHKLLRTGLLAFGMLALAFGLVWLLGLQAIAFDIYVSTFLGAAITTWRQPMTKQEQP